MEEEAEVGNSPRAHGQDRVEKAGQGAQQGRDAEEGHEGRAFRSQAVGHGRSPSGRGAVSQERS